jgi:hypothetical protein
VKRALGLGTPGAGESDRRAGAWQSGRGASGKRFAFENWSHDGKYLYTEDYSDKTDDLVRVNVANGKVERWFSLKEVPRGFDPWGFWIGSPPMTRPY